MDWVSFSAQRERIVENVAVEKYPFDFDMLKKGDVIPVERIELLIMTKQDHPKYSLRILRLKDQIESELERRGRPVTVRTDHGCLVILTDPEAAEYNKAQFGIRRHQLSICHQRTLQVNVTQLTDEQRKIHERNIVVQGAQLSAMRKAVRIAHKAHKRITPGLPASE